jgi:hypothetical protein
MEVDSEDYMEGDNKHDVEVHADASMAWSWTDEGNVDPGLRRCESTPVMRICFFFVLYSSVQRWAS